MGDSVMKDQDSYKHHGHHDKSSAKVDLYRPMRAYDKLHNTLPDKLLQPTKSIIKINKKQRQSSNNDKVNKRAGKPAYLLDLEKRDNN